MAQVSFKPPQIRAVASGTPNPVAHWPVSETSGTTIADTVGSVSMTLDGDAAFAPNELHGHSILYSTATGQAQDLTGGGTAPEPSTAITVMCWVRTSASIPNDYGEVMGKSTATYNTYGLLAHYGSGLANTPTFQYRTTNDATQISASSALLADHHWHHLAGTYDGSTVRLYCDGTQVASASATGTLVYEAGDRLTFLGNDRYDNQFVGSAAEFKMYDVALTQPQVAAAMGAAPTPGAPTLLKGYASTAISSSHVITLATASTPGKTIFLGAVSGGVISVSGWTAVPTSRALDNTDINWFYLPAASHTVSLTSITVGLSGAVMLSALIFEDDVNTLGITRIDRTAPTSSNTLWLTAAATIANTRIVAWWLGTAPVNAVPDGEIVSYNKGFTEIGDTGPPTLYSSGYSHRGWAAYITNGSLASESVTATLSPAWVNIQTPSQTSATGFISYSAPS